MHLTTVAFNNLKRRKVKQLFSVISLAIGIAIFIAIQLLGSVLQDDLAHQLDQYGANIVLLPESDSLNLTYGGISAGGLTFNQKFLDSQMIERIWQIKDAESISVVSPKVVGAAPTTSGQALLVGVDFQQEFQLKKWWELAGAAPGQSNQVIVGSEIAAKMSLTPGSQFKLADRTVEVSGVLGETGSQDDHAVFMELVEAQELMGLHNQINLVEISALCTTCPIEEIASQIKATLPGTKVTPLKQVVTGRMETTTRIGTFAKAISVLVVFISSLVVLTTLLNSVNERFREIGILRSIGFRRSHVAKIILMEAGAVGILGGLAGIALALACFYLGIGYLAPNTAVKIDWLVIGLSFAGTLLLSLAASIPGIIKATGLDPVEAIRVV